MKKISIKHAPVEKDPRDRDASEWGEWTLDQGRFTRHYGSDETCYIMEGEASIASGDGSRLEIRGGDVVSVPSGSCCTWIVRKRIRALYKPCPLYNVLI